MLVARVYSLLDRMVVEISCVHGWDPAGSHLLLREEREGFPIDQRGALGCLVDVADLAMSLTLVDGMAAGPFTRQGCAAGWG